MRYHPLLLLFALLTLAAAGGAGCPNMVRQYSEPPPVVFAGPPTLGEVIHIVNTNSTQVHQLQARGARLTVQGMPALQANIAYQQPRRFRLRAQTSLTGPELDLGSDSELFWLWVKRNRPPAVYFCRHSEFYQSAARQVVPIDPQWLIEAFGLVYLDPQGDHKGPVLFEPDRLKIWSVIPSPEGDLSRTCVIDATHGWVLEQHITDHRGRLLASALASQHHYDPASGVSLPRHVEIRLPPAMSFTIDVADYVVNQTVGDSGRLFTMPPLAGYDKINLADLRPSALDGTRPANLPQRFPSPEVRHRRGGYGDFRFRQ